MTDINTNKTDYAQARATFEVEDNAPHEPLRGRVGKKSSVPSSQSARSGQSWLSGSGRWIRFGQSLISRCPEWPGWPRFWQSRFSGVPVALIFGLYVYYLLVFVMLPTNVDVEIKKPMSDINASTLVSQIK